MTEHIRLEITDDKVAVATMVNGENRFRRSFTQELDKILDKVESDASVRALIIRGEGKFFSSGLDVDFLATQTGDYIQSFRDANAALYRRLCTFPIVTVAILNGHTFGAGAFLALSCDYRVMRSDRGWLCWPETELNMKFQEPSLELVRAKIPVGRAQRDAIIFSKRFTAAEAKTLGLVNRVASEDNLYQCALEVIKTALGARGLDRKSVSRMKREIYGKYITLSKI